MAMGYTDVGKNNMLAALGVTHCAPFDGDPASGGTEKAARKAIAMNTPSGGSMAGDTDPALEFNIGAGQKVNHVGYYDALTGGNLVCRDDVPEETFNQAGVYKLTTANFVIN